MEKGILSRSYERTEDLGYSRREGLVAVGSEDIKGGGGVMSKEELRFSFFISIFNGSSWECHVGSCSRKYSKSPLA